jgi:SecD/SecF fusion protein
MSQNYSGRVSLILFVLAMALVAALWPSIASPLKVGLNGDVPFSQKHNLKPGIDIVGGTSLLYEIKPPPGGQLTPDLAEKVTTALKKRVDPQGTRNLIWRPQNPNKLEIQMPLSGTGSGSVAAQRQQELEAARAKLEATNVRLADATAWVEQGEKRDPADLDRLAAGYPARKTLLADLAATHDALKKLEAERSSDPDKLVEHNRLEEKYRKLPNDLAKTNLPGTDLERKLGLRDSAARQKAIDAAKADVPNFPARAQAIDAYVAARKGLDAAGGGSLESAADLKRMLRGSGVLEFHILPATTAPGLTDTRHPAGYADWVKQLKESGPRGNPEDSYRWFEVDNPDEFKGTSEAFDDRHWVLASVKPADSLDANSGTWKLADASPTQNQIGQQVVAFRFDAVGGKLFGDMTQRHVREPMAIMLDGRVISAPNINEPITTGSGTISGGENGFSTKELRYLVTMLSSGALPAQLNEEPISERTVGPQLGEDNLRRGLGACAFGLVVVAVFLTGYYYLAGVVAFVGVLINLVIILGAMAAINATFTLPGIAAVVLTVGSAVDANVLIFERLREEQHRGLGIRMAVRNAYDRAFSAILDSNMTTLITSAALIAFGTEEVKGFGITLVIGILASLFTSLFVTKTVFGLLIDRFGVKKLGSLPLSIPKWDQMLRPNVRWTKLAIPFAGFSAAFILVGLLLFAKYAAAGQVLDIEFASGTAVTFEVKKPEKEDTVRGWVDKEAKDHPAELPAPSVVKVGTDGKTWEVTTPNAQAEQVREAILRAVGDNLNTELKIDFKGADFPFAQVVAAGGPATAPAATAGSPATAPTSQPAAAPALAQAVVLPITPETLADKAKWPGGFVPDEAKRFTGGAAVLLRDLSPKVTAKEITERLNRQKSQPQTGAAARAVGADFAVVAAGGPDAPVADAVLLTVDPARDYRKGEAAWRSDVVEPMWDLLKQAIHTPSKLQQVKNFNASVAGETQNQAMIALVLSLVFIMAYVWVRFGNLKYGTATVVALLHDVLFCFAALGFAHLLSGNAVGDLLQLQPFRISLTIVAGVLTIMGYSMLDTIVVFDRIREIRGKYGHVSPTVINDAVNQTLSRTLLTAGTTVISVAIMYFIGGEGIHGFTFILLVGILAGTYSSIAVAAPILLIGGKRTEETAVRTTRTAATT